MMYVYWCLVFVYYVYICVYNRIDAFIIVYICSCVCLCIVHVCCVYGYSVVCVGIKGPCCALMVLFCPWVDGLGFFYLPEFMGVINYGGCELYLMDPEAE